MIFDREALLERETKILAPYAVFGSHTRGREHKEQSDPTRTPFQRDRDRVIHSRAFRRLKGKTQVFVAHYGDHYRTRISHSLEVAQVSRDVARSLGLNEDLSEVIALAHDLGHTPFGHAGQDELNDVMKPFGLGFEHNQQSKRIVEFVERIYPNFRGLNLSFEVRQGLMKHQSPWDQAESTFHGSSLEAQLVNIADEIAYNNHDVDDGLRSGLITEAMLEELEIWHAARNDVEQEYGKIDDAYSRLSRTISAMFGRMIQDLVEHSHSLIMASGVQSLEDVYRREDKLIQFSPTQFKRNEALRAFLSQKIYHHPNVIELSQRGQRIIRELFAQYHGDLSLLPSEEQEDIVAGERAEIVIKDYIAGMTDGFAELEWERLCQ